MGIENFSLTPAEDPFQKEAEAIARAAGQDPDQEPEQKEADKQLHGRLMDWRHTEKERSQAGRDEMAIDADFKDGLQWSQQDAQVLRARGQDPVAFNRILPQCEWLVGTERRTRVDAKVLPRTKDDVPGARAQGDVLKYLHDVNNDRFHVSRAFDDAITSGLGWLEDYVNPDPTKEAIASRYESWRYIWYDSASYEFDLADSRYLFRERWTDLDLAIAMYPEHAAHLRFVAEGYDPDKERTEQFFLGMNLADWEPAMLGRSWNGFVHTSGGGVIRFGGRQRVRLIEFQYRRPARVQVFVGGPMHGQIYDKAAERHRALVETGQAGLYKTHRLVMRLCVMTERGIIYDEPSPYRHDTFSFTPVWGYRRARDNQPYGIVRNLRGIQEDLNKRFARSLYRLSSQQIIADEDATSDWTEFKAQAYDPNGILRKKRGSQVEFRTDYNTAEGDMKLMQQELLLLQDAGGPTAENLGQETNATSGRAVLARQQQGAITMERLFDNLRLTHQLRGQKKLSMIRQYMTEPQVLRLTDSRGRPEWLYINQADPTTGQHNDVVSAQADYIVSEQDFRASMRLAMFDTLMELLSRQPPEIAIQLLDLALEVGDLPNQDEIVKRVRKINGQADPDAQDDPEEVAKQQAAEQAAAAAAQLQQRGAEAQVAEAENKARKLAAEAAEIEARIGMDPANADMAGDIRSIMDQLRQAQETIALQKVQLANKGEEIALKRDELAMKQETEREKANASIVASENDAEIAREQSNTALATGGEEMEGTIEDLTKLVADLKTRLDKAEKDRLTDREKAVAQREKATESKPQQPIVVQVGESKSKKPRKRRITMKKNPDGTIVADVDESD